MVIDGIGALHKNEEVDEWLDSDPVGVPLLKGLQLVFTLKNFENDSTPIEFCEAIGNFMALTGNDQSTVAPYIYKNYLQFISDVGVGALDFEIPGVTAVWQHIYPTNIFVSRRHRGNKGVYVVVSAECDWEVEHGLQLVYKAGNILARVSGQDGALTNGDAYGEESLDSEICYHPNGHNKS